MPATMNTSAHIQNLNTSLATSPQQNICAVRNEHRQQSMFMMAERGPFVIHFGVALSLVAILLNGFLCVVLKRLSNKQAIRTYLMVICAMDIAFSVIYITLIAGGVAKDYFDSLILHNIWMLTFTEQFTVGKILRLAETYVVVCAGVDRAIVLHYESKLRMESYKPGNVWRRTKEVRVVVVLNVVLFSVATQLPSYWEYSVDTARECSGFGLHKVGLGVLSENTSYQKYKFYIAPIITCYFPIFTLMTTCLYSLAKLRSNLAEAIEGCSDKSRYTTTSRVRRSQQRWHAAAQRMRATKTKKRPVRYKPETRSEPAITHNNSSNGVFPGRTFSKLLNPVYLMEMEHHGDDEFTSTYELKMLAKRCAFRVGMVAHSEGRDKDSPDVSSASPSTASSMLNHVKINNTQRFRRLSSIVIRMQERRLRDAEYTNAVIILTYLISTAIDAVITFLEQYDENVLYNHLKTYTIASDISSVLVVLMGALRLPLLWAANTCIRRVVSSVLRRHTPGCENTDVSDQGSMQGSIVLMPAINNVRENNRDANHRDSESGMKRKTLIAHL